MSIDARSAPIAHFAMCPRGLEAALAEELRRLGAAAVTTAGGGVSFDANLAQAYAINLHSRLASRVLRRVAQARYRNDDDLYKLAARTPWEELLDSHRTLRVDVTAVRSPLRSLNFATLRIKDGIVDRLRDQTGERPSIDTRQPDVRVYAFLDERNQTLYVDLSGDSLFKRGWRDDSTPEEEDVRRAGGGRARPSVKGQAPLKENLAAGLLELCGWKPGVPLYDPFCGSGTIVIEAAQQAAGIAPGLARPFGFEKLRDFDANLWSTLRDQAQPAPGASGAGAIGAGDLLIAGSDIDANAVRQTRDNLGRAGVDPRRVKVLRRDFAQAEPPFDTPGIVLCNPPYGERIELRGAADGMGRFAETLKQRFIGWKFCVLTTDVNLPRELGMKEKRKTPLFNGPLECRLFTFEIFGRAAPRISATPSATPPTTPPGTP